MAGSCCRCVLIAGKSDTASRARAMPHGKVTMNYLDVAVTVISIVEVVVVYSSPTLLAAWSLQGAVQKTLKFSDATAQLFSVCL